MSALEARIASFAVQVNELTAQLRKVEDERDEYRKLVLHLKEENERLRRGLLGQKAERLPRNDAQLSLAILGWQWQRRTAHPRPRQPPPQLKSSW